MNLYKKRKKTNQILLFQYVYIGTRKVLDNLADPTILNGVNFDIEGLEDNDYMDLFYTMRDSWNNIIKSAPNGKHSLSNVEHVADEIHTHTTENDVEVEILL